MPNHFHLIIHANENSITERESFGGKPMQEFPYRMGLLQSSYAQAINKQNGTSGSLFQQKIKARALSEEKAGRRISYLDACLFYVHYNPNEAGLVTDLLQWPFSSYPDYMELRKGTLCNKTLLYQLTDSPAESLKYRGEINLTDVDMKKIF